MRYPQAVNMKDAPVLRDEALRHLARFATTQQRLGEVLRRRVERWAARARASGVEVEALHSQVARLHDEVPRVVAEMVRIGAINDKIYSASRAKALLRSGHSRRHAAAWLQTRGVIPHDIANAINEALGEGVDAGDREFAAALVFARKKRLGPFASHKNAAERIQEGDQQRALAAFARAGFTHDIARRALAFSSEEAMDAIIKLRSI